MVSFSAAIRKAVSRALAIQRHVRVEFHASRSHQSHCSCVETVCHSRSQAPAKCCELVSDDCRHPIAVHHVNRDFVITGSVDGHVQFWKKKSEGIELAKYFRAHLDAITSMSVNYNGTLLATASRDKTIKIFDVASFDMIKIISLDYVPSCCAWIHVKESPKQVFAWYASNG
jgi:WD40 repeat protein